MKTLRQLWFESGEKKGLKVRYADWGEQFKYFCIEEFDQNAGVFRGRLDQGERITYPEYSDNWEVYVCGNENLSHAI